MGIPTDFVTLPYVLSFTGMVVVVWMMTAFTKSLFDKIFQNQTRFIVYGWSLILSVIAAIVLGDWSEPMATVVIWLINSVIVWFTAMKAYETISDAVTK